MKKLIRCTSVFTAAAAAALSAGAALAQPNVALYGRLDLGVRYESASHLPSAQLDSGSFSGLGFKGQENLGAGLQAFFQMEHRLDAATGAPKDSTSFFNDIAVVGLRGDFGSVRLGRADNNFNLAADPDAFGGDFVGGRGNRRAGADDKWNNSLTYFSPEVAGWQLVLGSALAEGERFANGDRHKNPWAISMLYRDRALTAGLGYMQRPNQDQALAASLRYDLGVATTFLTIAHNDGAGNGQAVEGEIDGKRTTYDLGVAVPVLGAGSVRAKYNLDRQQITPASAVTKTHDLGLGYLHQLSARTQLYVTGNLHKREGLKLTRAVDLGIAHSF